MAQNRARRSTITNNAELGGPQIPLSQYGLLDGIKVGGQPVIVQVDFDNNICRGVLAEARLRNKITVIGDEKVKIEVGGHAYKVSTPRVHKDGVFAAPKVHVDGVQQKAPKMAARAKTDENGGRNICARYSVVVPLEGRTATCMDPATADNPPVAELSGGYLIVVVKDRLTADNSRPGTIEVIGFSKNEYRESWNI